MKYVYLTLGWVALGLAVLGVVLPLLPTTPFLLLAAACFDRGSPRFHAWLLDHRWFGPPIRDWRERGAIGGKAKALAIAMLLLSLAVLVYKQKLPPAGLVAFGVFVCGMSAFILTRPGR